MAFYKSLICKPSRTDDVICTHSVISYSPSYCSVVTLNEKYLKLLPLFVLFNSGTSRTFLLKTKMTKSRLSFVNTLSYIVRPPKFRLPPWEYTIQYTLNNLIKDCLKLVGLTIIHYTMMDLKLSKNKKNHDSINTLLGRVGNSKRIFHKKLPKIISLGIIVNNCTFRTCITNFHHRK